MRHLVADLSFQGKCSENICSQTKPECHNEYEFTRIII